MRIVIVIILTILAQGLCAQDKVKYNQYQNDFSIMVSKNYTLSKSKINNGYSETLSFLTEDKKFKYLLMISKNSGGKVAFRDLKNDNFEQEFKRSCGCEIIQKSILNVGKKEVFRFEITAQNSEAIFHGYSDQLIYKESLYSILFLSPANRFENLKEEYDSILSTFEPYK